MAVGPAVRRSPEIRQAGRWSQLTPDGGPGTTAWQARTQVILCTNEFLYLD